MLVNYVMGCIFEYDDVYLLGSGIGFKEEELVNFWGLYYLKMKVMVRMLWCDG